MEKTGGPAYNTPPLLTYLKLVDHRNKIKCNCCYKGKTAECSHFMGFMGVALVPQKVWRPVLLKTPVFS